LGEVENGQCAISPDDSDEILSLVPGEEFGLLIDLSTGPARS
jgi:hypothetical protein